LINNTVTEWCPHCEHEVELQSLFEAQPCPGCNVTILPCAQCLLENCANCPL